MNPNRLSPTLPRQILRGVWRVGEDNSSEEEELYIMYTGEDEVHEQLESSTTDEEESRCQQHFDTHLPSLHSYLGAELEVVRGRTVLEDETVVSLDLLHQRDLILMPGQTLPLTAFDTPTINMLQNCIRNDHTFGVLASWTDENNTILSSTGTTAEIYEYLPQEGSAGFRVKAKARQRFRLLEGGSHWKGSVRIMPEVRLPDSLDGIKLQSLRRLRSSSINRLRCRRADAAVTHWPVFVYEQYNIKRIQADINGQLSNTILQEKTNKDVAKVVVPQDPTELSFWVAQNMPLRNDHRFLLLKLNSPIQRLRVELQLLKVCQPVLCCQLCSNIIGSNADVFSMSSEGPQGTYVNPGGYLHETITLYKVRNIYSIGSSSTEFSWFPGYAWTICKCRHCSQHMGWKFKATSSKLKPVKFWGLCRRSFSVKMCTPQEVEDTNSVLVF